MDPRLCADPTALARAAPAPPSTLVVFGAGGDLTKRLLMPALYNMTVAGLLPEGFGVVGVDRVEADDEAYRRQQTETMRSFVGDKGGEFSADALDEGAWDRLRGRLSYMTGDFEAPETYSRLAGRLEKVRRAPGGRERRVYPPGGPGFFGPLLARV